MILYGFKIVWFKILLTYVWSLELIWNHLHVATDFRLILLDPTQMLKVT